jgi:glycerol kinase
VKGFIGAIDQGTTSTRFAVVDGQGRLVAVEQQEHHQIYPQPGWVEHDPAEIWQRTVSVVSAGLERAGLRPSDLAAVGVANQRETIVVWDPSTGEPLAPAIVWQDTRTAGLCAELAGIGGSDRFRQTTGLPLATYFSGPKMAWLLEQVPGLRDRAVSGEAVFGTIDSWLIWNLTGAHVTDVTNASRTLLMSLETLGWDPEITGVMGIPMAALPAIRPSVAFYGEGRGVLAGVPIAGDLGDQQAALFGQACFRPGQVKNTYGTGCFMLLNTGDRPVPSHHGLLTTVACQIEGRSATFALEGSVAIAGAGVQWLRDNLRLISSAGDVEALAASVADNAGAGHLARAVLESTAYQTRDVLEAMEADSGVRVATLLADGGMVANEFLMQFQADLLGMPVARSRVVETTALGAAYAAGLAVGFFEGLEELESLHAEGRRWLPVMGEDERADLYSGWKKAVPRSFDWV